MNKIKINDLEFGKINEKNIQPILEEKFNKLINNNDINKYHSIDFENDFFGVEYKRRRCSFGQYHSLMLNKCKIDKAKEYDKRIFFIWHCNDDLYYWELSDDYKIGKGGTTRRGKNEITDVVYIENKFIKKLSLLEL